MEIEQFGCCSRYERCREAGDCIAHKDLDQRRAEAYKKSCSLYRLLTKEKNPLLKSIKATPDSNFRVDDNGQGLLF